MRLAKFAPIALALMAAPLAAQDTPPAAAPAKAPPPKLVVVISVDQFSADLFAEYRNRFTGGFKRLLDGAVFPAGFQSHAATETCPGHSTIMTGDRPARTGIIANDWYDLSGVRPGNVYCTEDESKGPTMVGADEDQLIAYSRLGNRLRLASTAEFTGFDRTHKPSDFAAMFRTGKDEVPGGQILLCILHWFEGPAGGIDRGGQVCDPMPAKAGQNAEGSAEHDNSA